MNLSIWNKYGSLRVKIGKRREKSFIESALGLNFINVIPTAFTRADPKSVRTQSSRQYLFPFLGSACIKAVLKTLMKLTLDEEQDESKYVKYQKNNTVFFAVHYYNCLNYIFLSFNLLCLSNTITVANAMSK